MPEHLGLDFLRVGNGESAARGDDLARVAHLTSRFGVERGLVQHDDGGFPRRDGRDRSPFPVERRHFGVVDRKAVVAAELRRTPGILDARVHLEFARGAGALALALHRRLESSMVDHDAALARHVRSQIDGKTEGVVELEHGFAVEHAVFAMQRALEHFHSVLQRLGEALLLGLEHLGDALLRPRELRIGLAHRARQVRDEAVEERLFAPELVAVADGAADDAAKHVAASLVSGYDAVHDKKGACADVVGDHVQRIVHEVLRSRLPPRGAYQVPEQVDLVVRVHALENGCDSLQAHARVHAGFRQGSHRALVVPIELHENEIPDLDVAIAFGFARAGRAARDPGPVVVENLAAGTAGTRVGHLPEVIALVFRTSGLVADADAAPFRHADLLRPEIVGFVVLVIHRRPQALRRQLVLPGQQVPGIADRVALEVIAE